MTDGTAKIAVVGAGRMGHGIAQVFAAAGHPVSVYDPDPDARDSARNKIRAATDLLQQDADEFGTLTFPADLARTVEGADFVFEAGPEKLGFKRDTFARLSELTETHCILASNTSALPIGDISAALPGVDRIVGTHFWNPPYLVPLVEVVQTDATSPIAIPATVDLLQRVGMKPVHVRQDVSGLIGNRLQHALKREAIALVSKGVCDAETIDTVCRYGFGLRLAALGPMEQSDLVGLNLTADILGKVLPTLDNTATVPALLLERVAEGRLGMRTGSGFRDWSAGAEQRTENRLYRHLLRARRARLAGE